MNSCMKANENNTYKPNLRPKNWNLLYFKIPQADIN